MSKNVIVNGTTYNDVTSVKIPLAVGEGFAEFFEQASSGGGAQVATGSVVLANDKDYIDVENLLFTPKAFAIMLDLDYLGDDAELTAGVFCIMNNATSVRSNTGGSNSYGGIHDASTGGKKYDFSSVVISESLTTTSANTVQRTVNSFRVTKGAGNGFPFKANHKYNWIAIGWEDSNESV